jgi:hypothetical protein
LARGPRFGFWSAGLAASSPLFLLASFVARPETLLVFTSAALLWLVLAVPDRIELKPFLIGGLGLLQMSIHPNAAVVSMGVFVFYVYGLKGRARYLQGLLFVAGSLAGLLAAFLLVDAKRLWLGLHTVHGYLLTPPILAGSWRPIDWLWQTIHVMWTGQTYYFDRSIAPGWPLCLQMWWIAIAVLCVIASLEDSRLDAGRWLAAGFTVLVSSMALVKAKECLYGTNLFPFLIPLAASGLASMEKSTRKYGKVLALALAGASAVIFLNFGRIYTVRTKSYAQTVSDLRALLPPGRLKVAGPNVLWFVWDQGLFRDSGAILVSHWYTGGGRDLKAWLVPWCPDILILDDAMQNAIWPAGAPRGDLQPYLGCPVDFLGVLDTPGAYGRWVVYRIRWLVGGV